MRILYTNFHRGDGGGHTTYVLSLAGALRAAHEILVAAPPSSRIFIEACAIPGVRAIAMDFKGGPIATLENALCLRRILQGEQVDIAHVNGAADHRLGMLAAAGMGGRRPAFIYTQHNDRLPTSIGAWLRARFATDRVICVCEHTRQRLARSVFRNSELRTVHNGVDVERFRPAGQGEVAEAKRRWLTPLHAGRLVVGSVAGTADYKNWLDMVEGVAGLPADVRSQIVLLIAGELPTEAQRSRVLALGMAGSVIFSGLLKDVRKCIAAFDVGFVLSSKMETISFACREMMAMGVPVIVSAAGGLSENVHALRDGWIVPAKAPDAVAEILSKLVAQPHIARNLGQAAREKAVREFGLSDFVAKTHDVYREALGRQSQLPQRPALWGR